MIFATPTISPALERRLEELDGISDELSKRQRQPTRWIGPLRRELRAADIAGSTAIEGFRATSDDVHALIEGRLQADPDDQDRMAVACYAHAMDHVAALVDDDAFSWSDRLILDLHFDACSFQTTQRPGRWRRTAIGGTRADGSLAFEGPPPEQVAGLIGEVIAWLAADGSHPVVRGAMAHLHVVSIHPFQDGNGRIARIVQSLVLARDGMLAPELSSIEQYLGEHTSDYYAILERVQGGGYRPERDASEWLELCLDAHRSQGRRRLRLLEEAADRWEQLEHIIGERGWPERLVIALEQSLAGATDRTMYASEAGVSAATATADLRRLRDADLISAQGSGRNLSYQAGEPLRQRLQRAR